MSKNRLTQEQTCVRKVVRYSAYDATTLPDYLLIAAANIEDACISAGVRSADYTILDIMKMAVTLAAPTVAQCPNTIYLDVPGVQRPDSGD